METTKTNGTPTPNASSEAGEVEISEVDALRLAVVNAKVETAMARLEGAQRLLDVEKANAQAVLTDLGKRYLKDGQVLTSANTITRKLQFR